MGENTSSHILSESAQQICSQNFMHIPRKGLCQKYIKIVKFQILDFRHIFCSFFFWTFNIVINGELYKKARGLVLCLTILKTMTT